MMKSIKKALSNKYTFSSKNYSLVLYGCLIVLLLTFSYIFYMKTFAIKNQSSLIYKEHSNVDYNVNLKKNEVYDTDSLPSGMSYIANLINTIDLKLDYNFIANDELEYISTYEVNAVTKVYNDSDKREVLFERSEQLVKPETVKKSKMMHNDFTRLVKVDYDRYNNFINTFKSSYGLNSESDLTIELVVKTSASNENIDEDIVLVSKSKVVVPLSTQTLNIRIDSNNIDNYQSIVENRGFKDISLKYLFAFILSLLTLIVISTEWGIMLNKVLKERSKYDIRLNKILKDYDNIIGNIDNKFDASGYKIIKMSSFEELRDIHDNLGSPILYNNIKDHKKSEFIIINDNLLYKYELNEKDLISNGGRDGKKK